MATLGPSPMRMTAALRTALLAVMLALSPSLGAAPAAAQASETVGEIVAVTGAVTILRAGVARDAAAGDAVWRADLVVTGAESRVSVRFVDKAMLTVGPRTQVDISQFVEKPGGGLVRGVLSLISGIIRVAFTGDGESAFEVRTRTAVASVRSTQWIVDSTEEGTGVLVLDGRVAVRGRAGGEVLLAPGEGTDVRDGEPPTAPKTWGAPRVRDVTERTRAP